jgi:MFS family permease
VFWSTTIFSAVIQLACLLFVRGQCQTPFSPVRTDKSPESYGPILLQRRAAELTRKTGRLHRTEYSDEHRTAARTMATAMSRPFRLLFTQPIIQVLAAYQLFIYGVMYVIVATLPDLWETRYAQPPGRAGLNYASLGLGSLMGAYIVALLNDRIYLRLSARHSSSSSSGGGGGRPEFRVPLMYLGAALVPAGLLLYGWSAQARLHPLAPNAGAFVLSAGYIVGYMCSQTYVIDCYPRFAASASAAVVVVRSLSGFGFPLFAPAMLRALGYGWSNTLLALLCVALGLPAPFLLWRYGERLRASSWFRCLD